MSDLIGNPKDRFSRDGAHLSIYLRRSRRENLQLSSEYNKLQESYKQLEALKSQLEDKQVTWMSNLTDSQKETENTKLEVRSGDVTIATTGSIYLLQVSYVCVVLCM